MKNAIDWLVSGEEIIAKPVALAHASHLGEDMLVALRLVLGTVIQRFCSDLFLQLPLMSQSPDQVRQLLQTSEYGGKIETFLGEYVHGLGLNIESQALTRLVLRHFCVESVGKSVDCAIWLCWRVWFFGFADCVQGY